MQQNYVTEFILNALDLISLGCVSEGWDKFVAQELVARVTERLNAQSNYIRKDGMFEGELFSGESRFEELDGEKKIDIEVKKILNLNFFKTEIINYDVGYLSSDSEIKVKFCRIIFMFPTFKNE